MFLIFFSENTI